MLDNIAIRSWVLWIVQTTDYCIQTASLAHSHSVFSVPRMLRYTIYEEINILL